MNSSPILSLRSATKTYGTITVLQNLDIDIHPNEIIGIAGENGAGKSTTLKMIAGIIAPTSGTMELFGKPYEPQRYTDAVRSGVSMVFQEQALIPNLAIYENVFLSLEASFLKARHLIDRTRMIAYVQRHLEALGLGHIDARRNTSDYEFHDRQMVEIAKAFVLADFFKIDHPIILLDEPTAAIGERETRILFDSIRRFRDRASFVLITHRLAEYIELCDRIYVFKDGQSVGQVSGEDISEANLHRMMVGRARDDEYYKEKRQQVINGSAKVTLSVADLRGQEVEGVSFDLRAGEILGLGGLVGCGKEQVAKAIAGYDPFPTGGEIKVHGEALPVNGRVSAAIARKVGFVPKERKTEGIIPFLPVDANISLASLPMVSKLSGFISRRKERDLARHYIEKLRIRCSGEGQLCQYLSGGNQQKVALAKWLARDVDILVLDNPTRGVDVGAKEEIYNLLRDLTEQGVSILLVSDDLLELIGMSNRIIVLRDGKVTFERTAPMHDKPSEQELVSHMV